MRQSITPAYVHLSTSMESPCFLHQQEILHGSSHRLSFKCNQDLFASTCEHSRCQEKLDAPCKHKGRQSRRMGLGWVVKGLWSEVWHYWWYPHRPLAGAKAGVSPPIIPLEGATVSAALTLPLSAAPDVGGLGEPGNLQNSAEEQHNGEAKAEAEQLDKFWLPEEIAQEPQGKCPADVQVQCFSFICKAFSQFWMFGRMESLPRVLKKDIQA